MLPVVPENASPQTPQAPALPPVPPPPAREGGGGRKESPSNGKGKHNGSPTSAESSKHHFHLELPAVIKDPNTGKSYHRGRLLGKGGFARCYELIDLETRQVYAGKIVPKARIAKPIQMEKMQREIHVHSLLKHPNVVSFHRHFDDEDNIYIILELCSRKSLVQMLKLRKTFTEPEVRYFMKQIIEGVRYLHSHCVLHRDLKLGNMFLTDDMGVKIGDFGLAAKLEFQGDRKRTMCGTPNYIAPEVLGKIGHSFEADVWALGCILFTMLVGKPPFETSSLKETYSRIKHNKYILPDTLSLGAKSIITALLSSDPDERPPLEAIIDHEFFTEGYIPETLSPTACTTAPSFPITKVLISDGSGGIVTNDFCRLRRESTLQRRDVTAPLAQLKMYSSGNVPHPQQQKSPTSVSGAKQASTPKLRSKHGHGSRPKTPVTSALKTVMSTVTEKKVVISRRSAPVGIETVAEMLQTCIEHLPRGEHQGTSKYKPQANEVLWVTKWVDYSNKYGFGYQLSDRTVGVMFNDKSRISFSPDRSSVQYLSTDDKAHTFSLSSVPSRLSKKVTLLDYFSTYMDEHLVKGPSSDPISPTSPIGDLKSNEVSECAIRSPSPKRKGPDHTQAVGGACPYLVQWNRTPKAIAMYLSNGTFQMNLFDDHTKLVLNHNDSDHLITYINEERIASTYRLIQVTHHGCSTAIAKRLHLARERMQDMMGIGSDASEDDVEESTDL
ncbi:serine/threonine-protein kinase PLK1-like [Asterias amurensis]|uniref:serine/threonine-protein kinase PLK1-like n=1 Tax=Asterias amurensis TaxID=7602 RepID=UPI003AB17E0A